MCYFHLFPRSTPLTLTVIARDQQRAALQKEGLMTPIFWSLRVNRGCLLRVGWSTALFGSPLLIRHAEHSQEAGEGLNVRHSVRFPDFKGYSVG